MLGIVGPAPVRSILWRSPQRLLQVGRGLLLAGLLFYSMASQALDKAQLPVSPNLPTVEDCRQLSQMLHRMLMARYNEVLACMRGESRFTTLPPQRGRCEQTGYVAWAQCVEGQEETCRFQDYAVEENNKCTLRANQLAAAANDKQRLQTAMDLAQLNQFDSQAKNTAKAFGAAYLAITDPTKLLQKALYQTDKALLGTIFPSLVGQIGRNDTDLAEQLYKFAYQRAKDGTRLMPNALIGRIQESSLRRIDSLYADVFGQMNSALADMNASQRQLESLRFDVPPPRPAPRAGAAPDRECEILDDFASASKLRDDDVERFKALTRRCTGR